MALRAPDGDLAMTWQLGFTNEELVPGMILRPTELFAGAASGLEITRCEDPAELAVACAVAAAGFDPHQTT